MLRIITDSASDITKVQAEQMGVEIVPLTITFEDGICPHETEVDFEMFYKRLAQTKDLPVTSQPSPQAFLKKYAQAKDAGDEVLVICISSGLSGTFQSANLAKDLLGYDRIQVVDSMTTILGQRMLVEYAVRLRSQGQSGEQIAQAIRKVCDRVLVFGLIDTLLYLKKGGRIPPALAAIGGMLRIKPVVILKDGILQSLAKTRGHKAGMELLQKQLEIYKLDPNWPVYFGYTVNRQEGYQFMEQTLRKHPLSGTAIFPVGGVIGTHVGPNCLTITLVKAEGQ